MPPALTIVLLAFAYFEEGGILLSLTLFVIFGLVLTALWFAWQAALSTPPNDEYQG